MGGLWTAWMGGFAKVDNGLGILDIYKGDYRLRVFIERDKNYCLLQYRYLRSKKNTSKTNEEGGILLTIFFGLLFWCCKVIGNF
jgi:hypothetical protein